MIGRILNKNFLTVSYAEFWHKVNYYGIQSILILYLIKQFGLSEDKSYAIYGCYTGLSFGFSILGGYIEDKILGSYYTTFLACILIFTGETILLFHHIQLIFAGLSFITLGFGLFKSSIPNLIGFLQNANNKNRNNAFSRFYVFANMGSMSGPLLYGIFINSTQYFMAFLCGAIGILSSLFFLILRKKTLAYQAISLSQKRHTILIAIILLSILSIYFLLIHDEYVILFFCLSIILAAYNLYQIFKKAFKLLIQLIIPILSSITFFTVLLQIYSSLTLYIERYVPIYIFNWKIPTAWFSIMEPIMLLIIAPFINVSCNWLNKKNNNNPNNQILIGLVISGIAYLCFSYATQLIHPLSVIIFLLFGYCFLGISELIIIPTTISITNLLSPTEYKGRVMGLLYFSFMSSGYLSAIIARKSPEISATQSQFGNFFLCISTILIIFPLTIFAVNIFAFNFKKILPNKLRN